MKLSFSIIQNEFIRVQCDTHNSEVTNFFFDEFEKKFENNEILIKTPIFMKSFNNVNAFLLINNIQPELSDDFLNFVNLSPRYDIAKAAGDIPAEKIIEKIQEEGFIRTPTKDQLKNLRKLCSKKAAASFSVPGAGKTTEALAFYAFHKLNKNTPLLVISPPSAFISWEDEIVKCFSGSPTISRLRGTPQEIKGMLKDNTQHLIINYDSLRNIEKFDLIKSFILANNDLVVVLDESHKSKGKSISEIIGRLSPYINFKIILTGTPMPQAPSDLRSQFNFLYPSENIVSDQSLIETFQPLFVRTTKDDMGLMEPKVDIRLVKPYPAFDLFFKEYFVRNLDLGSSLEDILSIKSFKKAVLRFIKLLSNPSLCIDDIFNLDPGLVNRISDEGDGAKMDALIDRARELIADGEKVLIWSSFVDNVEIIAGKFGSKAEFIHGGVPIGKDDDIIDTFDTRDKKIRRFKEDPECMVLVANPAAAAESISLHEHCNHALYLDRTYNAGQFLQSQDRIHRLISKDKEKQKYIDIFVMDIPWCVDWKVHEALIRKIDNMAEFLNDPSLKSLEGFNTDLESLNNENPATKEDQEAFYIK